MDKNSRFSLTKGSSSSSGSFRHSFRDDRPASFHDVLVTDDEEHTPLGRRDSPEELETQSYQFNDSRMSELDIATAIVDKIFLDDDNRYIKGMAIIAISALFSGLGNSMVPNSVLSLLHSFCLLVGLDWIFTKQQQTDQIVSLCSYHGLGVITYIILIQGLGFCLGFYSMFGYPHDTFVTVMESFGAGILAWILYTIFSILPYLIYTQLFPASLSNVFVFPVLQTTTACAIIGHIFSVYIIPANSALDYEPLKQLAGLCGIASVNFVYLLCSAYPAYVVTHHRLFTRTTIRKWSYSLILGSLIILVITAFLNHAPSLLQKNISELIDPVVPVSCVFSQGAEVGTDTWYQLWNRTENRVKAGDAIVLMAEESMTIKSTKEESDMIAKALAVAQKSPAEKGVLVGLLYMLQLHGKNGMSKNRFVLVSYDPINAPNGEVLWTYDKAHPVPLVEINITPGKEELPFAHTNYGYASGAICFDLDFPQYIAQAGREQVDIFLQPSWTWNAINFRHFEGDAIRAIENGFTLFRCSSDGESGVVSPQGKFLHRQETGHDPDVVALFSLPLRTHANPMFPFVGFIFEYLCIAGTAYIIFYCCMGFSNFKRGVSFNAKV
jgi:apolipoprotein N-acyltransferase